MAGRVDALYFFLLAVSGLLLAADRRAHRLLRDPVPPPVARRASARPSTARMALEITWTVIPFVIVDGHLRLGRERLLRDRAAARRDARTSTSSASSGCGSSSTSTASARSTSCTCRSAAPVKLIMTSEDVIHDVFVPGVPHQGGRAARAATRSIWFQATKPGRYHLFCAEYCGTRHSGMIGEVDRDGAGRVPGVAERRRARRLARRRPARSCSAISPATPATAPTRRGAARCSTGLFGKTVQLQSGETVVADEAYIRESILNPAAKVVGRLPADHADVPGAGQRRGAAAADRVRQVAQGAAARPPAAGQRSRTVSRATATRESKGTSWPAAPSFFRRATT